MTRFFFALLFSPFHVSLFFDAFLSVYCLMLTYSFNASLYRFRRFLYVAGNFSFSVSCLLLVFSVCSFVQLVFCLHCFALLFSPFHVSLFFDAFLSVKEENVRVLVAKKSNSRALLLGTPNTFFVADERPLSRNAVRIVQDWNYHLC